MSDQLEILTTWESTRLYIDSGTGAHQDLGVFSPVIPSGYYMVGHFAQRDHSTMMKGIVPLVKPLVDGAIKPPLAFEQVWNDKGSGDIKMFHFGVPFLHQVMLLLEMLSTLDTILLRTSKRHMLALRLTSLCKA